MTKAKTAEFLVIPFHGTFYDVWSRGFQCCSIVWVNIYSFGKYHPKFWSKPQWKEFENKKIVFCPLKPHVYGFFSSNPPPLLNRYRICRNKRPLKTVIFQGGGSAENRWALMGDFSKGGVHKTDGFWWVIFQRGEYTKPMGSDGWFSKGGSTQKQWLLELLFRAKQGFKGRL